ncbi:substrate-binding domain-containing protein [Pseudomonas sichuanensis]|uniref:substrate-binding domain-containing protein n=1 Tax=Pseudomonas sichuanensis TaxID=2213015 RepID=UPI00244964DC|nr:substrate-binding domain-containing protein [Pseudomonas sichuanensis]MDH0730168.1 substrate-binding domain-containing protein [Pseudomonas sichuanensis]MDH1581248.1 substrate-binding domain-containing protein [Pseudomonas sichuanensis]MDH1593409.1 substrate-binding domain-containing protein [Pseudomonas sichuanensis]MDH1597164.1 substrate-binding domain-containing protein [Pseudomonas sichuanensis]
MKSRRSSPVVRTAFTAITLGVLSLGSSAFAEVDRLQGVVPPLTATKPLTIGASLVHLQDDFWKGIAYGIADEAKLSNVKVVQLTVAGGYGKVREQFGQLETLQSLGVNTVVLGAAAFDGYTPLLKRLKASGINVAAAGIPVNSPSVDFGVGQSDVGIGAALAGAVCTDKGAEHRKVIVVPGPAGAEWARLRAVGFNDAAAKCAGLEVINGAQGGGMNLESGLAMTSDLLQTNSDASYAYTPAIPTGMGAVQAVKQQGSQAKVVTGTITRRVVPLIENKQLLAVASEPGILIGRLIVQYAIRQNEGLPMPAMQKSEGMPYPQIAVPNQLLQSSNVKTYPYDVYDLPPEGWSPEQLSSASR